VTGVHAQGYLRLPAVASKVALADQETDEEALGERIDVQRTVRVWRGLHFLIVAVSP
jgi:hypothetical protein